MSIVMDDIDRRLLGIMQKEVPFLDRPFEAIARELGASEDEVIRRLAALKASPGAVIRQISGIFDTASLGYESSLVAAKVPLERLDAAAAAINLHPGVTHNYQRNHDYNLWYTVAVPPGSRLGLERTVQILHERSGASATRMLPTLKLYKIGVSFDLTGETEPTARAKSAGFAQADRQRAMQQAPAEADQRMIRVLQQDLPIVARPFDAWAAEAGVSVAALLEAGRSMIQRRWMRRFSAVLHHRQAGFSANAMGVWAVPAETADEFGAMAAGFAAVSHCYLRPTYEDWPYSVFTMVHGTAPDDCEATLGAIAVATGVGDYRALYSSRQFKKTRLKYFVGDIERWERESAG